MTASKSPKILLLTGPAAAGKTTIAKLLAEQFGFLYLDCDKIDSQFLPEGLHYLLENSPKLKSAHQAILATINKNKTQNKPIVLDYIIFGHYKEFIHGLTTSYPNTVIAVLFPTKEEMIKRDIERDCWTAGEKRIREVYADFERLEGFIGEKNYLDTTNQTPEQTIASLKKRFPLFF